MSFAANYAGRCHAEDCTYGDGRIQPGDQVEYENEVLMHVECAATTRRREPPFCKDCNTFHNGPC